MPRWELEVERDPLANAPERKSVAGWNGKGMWLSYSPGSLALSAASFWSPCNKVFAEQNGGTAEVLPCITMKTADGKILMGWLASQTDMLSDDWGIVLDAAHS